MATNKTVKKHRGTLALLLGVLLMAAGGILLTRYGGRLEYILTAPAATQEGGELNAFYEDAQKQIAAIADSIEAGAVGARAQGMTLTAGESGSAEATVYAVGSGYFDVVHETLLSGRLISEADVKRKENVIVIDESVALSFFAGDDPLNGKVTLNGVEYEVAGIIKGGRRLGETDEHVAYIPITAASGNALAMQTVEIVAKTDDSTTGSAILMRDSLEAWRTGGSFYNYDKLTMGATMPLRWITLFVGAAFLLSLVARLNAAAWGRICYYAEQLKTRYARDMIGGKRAALSAGLCGVGGRGVSSGSVCDCAAVRLYGVGSGGRGGAEVRDQPLLVAQPHEFRCRSAGQPRILRDRDRTGASALGHDCVAARRSDEWHSVLLPEGRNAEHEQGKIRYF